MNENDYWEARFRHPATRGMFKRWEKEVENEDFNVHAVEAMTLANTRYDGRGIL